MTGMLVRLGRRQGPVPDVVVVAAPPDARRTEYRAEEVVLAIEITSAESEERDRTAKPGIYARAGIPHFWRVEYEQPPPAVHVFELDVTTGAYIPTGIHRGSLDVPVPFAMSIDLTALITRDNGERGS
jgi:Uma2 family endonuclease